MGAFGTSVKKAIDSIINNRSIRSSIIITPLTKNTGSYGSYTAIADTAGSIINTYGVPSNYIKDFLKESYGVPRIGTSKIVVKSEEVITEESFDYKITWQSQDWEVKKIDRPFINDVVVCQILDLAKIQS